MSAAPRLTVALLAVPESTASTLHGMYDLFMSAGRDWDFLTRGVPGEQMIRPVVVSADGKRFRAVTGLPIEPDCALADCPPADIIAVPDLLVAPNEDIGGRYVAECEWLKARYAGGAT
ncbi:MAG: AraC family transcriptional regulator, partial [Gammaproteobacteria bacterium]